MADSNEKAQGPAAKVKGQVEKGVEAIRSTTGALVDHAKEVGGNALESVQSGANQMTEAVSGSLKSTARSIRENGPREGNMGSAAATIAQTFSNSANYLDTKGAKGIAADLNRLIENNPISSLMLGIGLGFLVGRASRRI